MLKILLTFPLEICINKIWFTFIIKDSNKQSEFYKTPQSIIFYAIIKKEKNSSFQRKKITMIYDDRRSAPKQMQCHHLPGILTVWQNRLVINCFPTEICQL